MTGATAKSKPTVSKIDERELSRLQKQDYWLQITRAKLLMDLIFVCKLLLPCFMYSVDFFLQRMIFSELNGQEKQ